MLLVDKIKATVRDVHGYPKPGIVFKDITPLLSDPALMSEMVREMISRYRQLRIDAVAGIEARGFIIGSILAHELGCGFIPVRKAGKLPFHTRKQKYDLEYGTAEIEIHADACKPGSRILIHDDLLATGGTAKAAGQLIRDLGAEVTGFSFLINLGFLPGEAIIKEEFGLTPDFLIKY
jgi:adenine phosphoribosyltransferase